MNIGGKEPFCVYKAVRDENGQTKYYSNAFGLGWDEDEDAAKEWGFDSDSHYCTEEDANRLIEIMQEIYYVKDGKICKRE